MLISMTGFGRATAKLDGLTATVEIRSVNNRFCEVAVRAPRELSRWETEMVNRVKKEFARGRFALQVQVDYPPTSGAEVTVNKDAAKRYVKALKELRKTTGTSYGVRLEHLLTFPDVFIRADSTVADESVWQVTKAALDASIEGLAEMRMREGAALQRDLEKRVSEIERQLAVVKERAPHRVAEARERLRERLADVLADERVNADRLEFELVLVADKLEITEEIVRLRSHIEQFRESLSANEPAGRKLNFIYQEMNREVNTIGSKANDALLTRAVVTMKEELEKVREQVENVE
jgi:uncharacterized protein (TIGR00255 family)